MRRRKADAWERRWVESRSERCAICKRMGTRVGEQGGAPVVDVLCHVCFENAPIDFKLTPAQDVFRDAVRGGCHPRIALARAGYRLERA